jgi:exonuclease VII small subunit
MISETTAARETTRMDGLFEGLETKIDQTQQITNRIAGAVGRLSGVMEDEGKKDNAPTPVRNGVVGRFEDNLDRLEGILNKLGDVAAHLDTQV